MSVTYTQVFKVPVWVILNNGRLTNTEMRDFFIEADAKEVAWGAETFPLTVDAMSRKGWHHIVNQKMPYVTDLNFLQVAINSHIQYTYGTTKYLSGAQILTIKNLNKKIETGDDYVRLYNDVMAIEPDINMSKLFDIAENCKYNKKTYKVFFSCGNIPKNILQKVSNSVITIGGEGSDIVYAGDTQETINKTFNNIASLLGIN